MTRKYIRIGLSDADTSNLIAAKRKTEDAAGIQMSDSMFVLSVLRKAIDMRN
jgi:hypothetical protein